MHLWHKLTWENNYARLHASGAMYYIRCFIFPKVVLNSRASAVLEASLTWIACCKECNSCMVHVQEATGVMADPYPCGIAESDERMRVSF